jgi:hexosaminidase
MKPIQSFYKISLTFLFVISFISCQKQTTVYPGVIPKPVKTEMRKGSFTITPSTVITFSNDDTIKQISYKLKIFLKNRFNLDIKVPKDNPDITQLKNKISFLLTEDKSQKNEGYTIDITETHILVKAPSYPGLYYGMQTLKQMLSPKNIVKEPTLPCLYIKDYPAFKWRGFMLDVSRHFFPKDSVKKIIDIMAMHKLNKFHWHLDDGIGWRIQIDKYPLLTERGAWRINVPKDKPWKQYNTCFYSDTADCYGGFYTKKDIKEIVQYAKEHYIDVIPEIEMPGHSHAALECYPELICKNRPNIGVYCAGNEKTFEFIEDVLSEVMELFPYKYIHIGGDEVKKDNWLHCELCRKRMKTNNLKSGEELQSYFIKRIEKFLNKHDKTLIGWDEILEGGVPPRATVMSWRGMSGGIEAVKSGHDVIMTPTNPCYFDFKQGNNIMEPDSYHGYNNLLKVYDFNPVPENINTDNKHHILGVQANLWTEKVPTLKHAEYMMLPRLSALSEIAWSDSLNKNRKDFIKRLDVQFDRFTENGFNFSWSSATPEANVVYNPEKQTFILYLFNEIGLYDIHYTLNGTEPDINSDIYTGPVTFTSPITLYAKCYRNGKFIGYPFIKDYTTNFKDKWTLKYKYPYDDAYNGGGERALCDGKRAENRGDDKRWQGFPQKDLDLIINTGGTTDISEVDINFFQYRGVSAATFPKRVVVSISEDGKNYTVVFDKKYDDINKKEPMTCLVKARFKKQKAGYVHIFAENWDTVPDAGGPAWLFVDEVDIK